LERVVCIYQEACGAVGASEIVMREVAGAVVKGGEHQGVRVSSARILKLVEYPVDFA